MLPAIRCKNYWHSRYFWTVRRKLNRRICYLALRAYVNVISYTSKSTRAKSCWNVIRASTLSVSFAPRGIEGCSDKKFRSWTRTNCFPFGRLLRRAGITLGLFFSHREYISEEKYSESKRRALSPSRAKKLARRKYRGSRDLRRCDSIRAFRYFNETLLFSRSFNRQPLRVTVVFSGAWKPRGFRGRRARTHGGGSGVEARKKYRTTTRAMAAKRDIFRSEVAENLPADKRGKRAVRCRYLSNFEWHRCRARLSTGSEMWRARHTVRALELIPFRYCSTVSTDISKKCACCPRVIRDNARGIGNSARHCVRPAPLFRLVCSLPLPNFTHRANVKEKKKERKRKEETKNCKRWENPKRTRRNLKKGNLGGTERFGGVTVGAENFSIFSDDFSWNCVTWQRRGIDCIFGGNKNIYRRIS